MIWPENSAPACRPVPPADDQVAQKKIVVSADDDLDQNITGL